MLPSIFHVIRSLIARFLLISWQACFLSRISWPKCQHATTPTLILTISALPSEHTYGCDILLSPLTPLSSLVKWVKSPGPSNHNRRTDLLQHWMGFIEWGQHQHGLLISIIFTRPFTNQFVQITMVTMIALLKNRNNAKLRHKPIFKKAQHIFVFLVVNCLMICISKEGAAAPPLPPLPPPPPPYNSKQTLTNEHRTHLPWDAQ